MDAIHVLQKEKGHYKIICLVSLMLFLMASCVTTKKSTYIQEKEDSTMDLDRVVPESYRIMINDNLYIKVATPDPKWSAIFNTIPVESSTMSVGEQAVDLLSYAVQPDGTVEIPYLGSIKVINLTLNEAKELVEIALADYVSNASVTLKLVNNYISILGEVNRPGRYPIYKDQLNIFQALAMAGDISDFGNRYEVTVIRQTVDSSIVKEFDLTDKNILDTEYYYVMPNDVVYAKPMKGKFFNMNQFPFALILTSITTFILLLNYIQNP